MPKRGKKKISIAKKPISWPIESQRDSNIECKTGPTLRRISISWPADNSNVCNDDNLLSEDGSNPSSCSQSSPPKRSASLSSTKRDMSLGSILMEGRSSPPSIEPHDDYQPKNGPFEFESPNELPSDEAWELARDVPLVDSDGNTRPFKSIFTGQTAVGEQQLVIFVRHFFCGACQAYLKALSKSISLQTYFALPVPTSITIIGFGSPALLEVYRRNTGIPFAIFTDPSRTLYKLLGMSWSLSMGSRPKYFNNVNEFNWILGQLKQMKKEKKELRFRGGAWWWVGGEFLIRDQKVIWCHRMKNYRDHAEIDVVKKMLGAKD